jgi:hypothetical protein
MKLGEIRTNVRTYDKKNRAIGYSRKRSPNINVSKNTARNSRRRIISFENFVQRIEKGLHFHDFVGL